MTKIKLFFKNDSNIKYILIVIFLLSVVVRTLLGKTFGQMNVFYDELLHWNLSKSVYYHLGNNFRNDILNYKEILYSMAISFSHYFGNTEMQYYVAVGINSVLMSSVILPIYLMSCKFLNNKHQAGIVAFLGVMIPEMVYTSKILQENLYYPMAIWFFYIFIVVILKNQYKLRNIILLACYVFLLSLCKQMALNVFAGVVLYYLSQFIFFDKENRKRCMIGLIWFIAVFMGLKFAYGLIFNLVNGLSTVSSSEVTISVILGNLLDPYLLSRLIYPALSYIMMSTLLFGFFTIILPLSLSKELTKNERNLFLIIGTILISTIAVICLRIVPSENRDEVIMRFHFRYLFFLLTPLLILFFSLYDKILNGVVNMKTLIMCLIFILLLNYISIIPEKGSDIDCVGANYIKYLFDNEMMINTLHMLIILIISTCLYLLYKKKIKLFYAIILGSFIVSGVVSNCYTYTKLYTSKKQSIEKKEDAFTLNTYFDDTIGSDMESVLIISETKVSDGKLELYLQYPNYYFAKKEDFTQFTTSYPSESFEALNLYSFNNQFNTDNIGYPEYIISYEPIYINDYEKVDIDLTHYHLYTKSDNDVPEAQSPQ